MLDPRGIKLLVFCTPRSASVDAEDVLPEDTRTKSTHIPHIHVNMIVHTDHREKLGVPTRT